jgi:hypothetical protein
VRTVSSSPSTALTNLTTAVTAGAGLSTGGQDVRTQNYSFQLITDPKQLWRLKALYRFVIDGNEEKFVEDFPPLYKTVTMQRNACLHDASKHNAIVYGTGTTTDPNSALPNQPFTSCITQYGGGGTTPTMSMGTDSFSILIPDEHYRIGPTCLVCRKCNGRRSVLVANDKLKGRWLHWRSLPGATRSDNYDDNDIPLGQYGHYELFVDRNQADKFADFSIFALAASTLTDSAVSGGSGGGGAGGGGGGGASKGQGAQPAGLFLTLPTIP